MPRTHYSLWRVVYGIEAMLSRSAHTYALSHEARATVEEALKAKGLWVGKKSHAMRLGFCSRSKDPLRSRVPRGETSGHPGGSAQANSCL